MSLSSWPRFEDRSGAPEWSERNFEAGGEGSRYDFDALGRARELARDALGQRELADALRELLAARETGACMRAGDWYVEAVDGGVCLSPYSAGTGPDRPKSFVPFDRLNVALADLAVPSMVSDALPQGAPERPKVPEDRASMLAKLLQDNPTAERFYSFGDLVSPSRAEVQRIVGPGNFPQIREHRRSELVREVGTDARYTPESAKERISKEVARLDAQIDRAGERDARTLQNLLIDVRQNLAGNAPTDFSLQTGEAIRNMTVTVDRMLSPGYEVSSGDVWDFTRDSFHLLRGSISTASGQVLSEIKDLTSRRLFELGPKEAPVERFIREGIAGDTKNPDMVSRGLIAWMKNTPASMAGIIDGTLDTTQSGVDLAVATDKVLENVKGFVGGLSLDFVKTLASEMASEAEMADFVYCAAYVLTVFVAGWRLGPEIWVLTIPNLIAKLVASGTVPAAAAEKISRSLAAVAPELHASAERLAKQLPNAGATVSRNIRGGEKIVSKTDDVSTTSGTVVPPGEALGRARTLFERANSTAMIADTFSTAMRGRMQDGMTPAENADLAVDLFVESFSEGKQNTRAELRAWRESETNGRTNYWLERTETRFDEVERVFELEVVPLVLAQEKAWWKKDPSEARAFAAMLQEKWTTLSPLARAVLEK